MSSIYGFRDLSTAFYQLFDPVSEEIDPNCCYCFDDCNERERIMVCLKKGGIKEHYTHVGCQEDWAQNKRREGVSDSAIHCEYSGVCTTNLAHLLPKKSFREKAYDFFHGGSSIQILTVGAAMLGISQAVRPIVFAVGDESQAAANIISTAVSILCLTPIARSRVGTKEVHSGAIALMGVVGGSFVGLGNALTGNWMCLSPFMKAAGMVLSAVGGEETVAVAARSRDFITIAAATAAVACASALIHGGSLFMGGALAAASIWGSYRKAR